MSGAMETFIRNPDCYLFPLDRLLRAMGTQIALGVVKMRFSPLIKPLNRLVN